MTSTVAPFTATHVEGMFSDAYSVMPEQFASDKCMTDKHDYTPNSTDVSSSLIEALTKQDNKTNPRGTLTTNKELGAIHGNTYCWT